MHSVLQTGHKLLSEIQKKNMCKHESVQKWIFFLNTVTNLQLILIFKELDRMAKKIYAI